MQNEFHKFITGNGFNLYRGDIGSNKDNQSKLEYDISEEKAELQELNEEKNTLKIIENSKKGLKYLEKESNNKDLLNPVKRKVIGYKDDDINNLSNYAKKLEGKVIILDTDNKNKDIEITKLTKENEVFKNNKEYIKQKGIIKEQKSTINSQNKEINRLSDLVDILNNNIESLKEKLNQEIEKWKNRFNKLCNAIDKALNRKPTEYISDYENLADVINYGYYSKDKSKDDFEL